MATPLVTLRPYYLHSCTFGACAVGVAIGPMLDDDNKRKSGKGQKQSVDNLEIKGAIGG